MAKEHRGGCQSVWSLIIGLSVVLTGGAAPAQDEVEGPWGTANGDIYGTAATDLIPFDYPKDGVEEAWRLDVRAEGQDRVAGRNPISFDKDGNLYWKTSIAGGTGGAARVCSVSPEGTFRWAGNDGAGNVHVLGGATNYDSTGVVVGRDAVYAVGASLEGTLLVAAYKKTDGSLLWQTGLAESLPPDATTATEALTPVLHGGKLYVVGVDAVNLKSQNIYRIDVAGGDEDWFENLPDVAIKVAAHPTFIPEAFGAGEHGLYFNGDSGAANDGVPDVYGIKCLEDGAELAWSAEGGKVARSHLIYSETTDKLYAHTWTDYGAELYTYDPINGFVAANNNTLNTGHGFFDVGCLDFNGDIIAGGFEGHLIRYSDLGDGTTSDVDAYQGDINWGEYRVYGQLLQDGNGDSILITGTNSRTDLVPPMTARVVAINVTTSELVWEFDSGVDQNHGYTIRGGPLAGPDGKVYFFHAITGELIALKPTEGCQEEPDTVAISGPTEADAGASVTLEATIGGDDGGTATYKWAVTSASGSIVGADDQKTVSVTLDVPGEVTVEVTAADGVCDDSATASWTVTFLAVGGLQAAMDGNQDGKLDISDPVWVLGHLFLGTNPTLPCDGGTASNPGPGALTLLDVNADGGINISDPVYALSFLFTGGPPPRPPLPGTGQCVRIVGCPDKCVSP